MLTDDEINARVAEIEGWTFVSAKTTGMTTGETPYWRAPAGHVGSSKRYRVPPYTADWSLCGPLIENYKLDLHLLDEDPDHWEAWHGGAVGSGPQLKRAICLAVIALVAAQHEAMRTGWPDMLRPRQEAEDERDEEIARLRALIRSAIGFLENDLYATRVNNALRELREALEER